MQLNAGKQCVKKILCTLIDHHTKTTHYFCSFTVNEKNKTVTDSGTESAQLGSSCPSTEPVLYIAHDCFPWTEDVLSSAVSGSSTWYSVLKLLPNVQMTERIMSGVRVLTISRLTKCIYSAFFAICLAIFYRICPLDSLSDP